MKEQITKNFLNEICQDFSITLFEAIKENKESFPYTLACINFITELRSNHIETNFNSFGQDIIDNVYRELSFYLSKE